MNKLPGTFSPKIASYKATNTFASHSDILSSLGLMWHLKKILFATSTQSTKKQYIRQCKHRVSAIKTIQQIKNNTHTIIFGALQRAVQPLGQSLPTQPSLPTQLSRKEVKCKVCLFQSSVTLVTLDTNVMLNNLTNYIFKYKEMFHIKRDINYCSFPTVGLTLITDT